MKRKTFTLVFIYTLLFSLISGIITIRTVNAITITVPEDYPTIQEALNAANSGDTIIVKNGTYPEHVVINKTLTLQSNERAIINASHDPGFGIIPNIARWIGITIMANYTTVKGFKIVNSTNYGIEIRADHCIIQDNIIESSLAGIYCYGPDDNYSQLPKYSPKNNSILNNTLRFNDQGIMLYDTKYNEVDSNIFEKNLFCGIYITVASSKNTISKNFFSQNKQYGIVAGREANNNLFFGNIFSENKLCGISLERFGSGPPAYTNFLFHNVFFDNGIQATDYANYNMWDGGPETGGNFWNDYNGLDLDGDGFGDTTYEIRSNGTDRYPLMTQPNPLEPVPPIPQPEPVPTPSPEPEIELFPKLTIDIRCLTSDPVFKFEIQGKLRMEPINGIIASVPVTLQYSVNGSDWHNLAEVMVDDNGLFNFEWQIEDVGDYLISGVYGGNASFARSDAIFNLATLSYAEPNDFSFFSNSTVANLSFNSEKEELSFSVDGESGTTGYMDVYISKNLVKNITLLKVYVDEEELNYSSELVDDSWKIHFLYAHSIHSVLLRLNPTIPREDPDQMDTFLTITIVGIIGIIVVLVVFGILKIKKNADK